MNNVSEFFGNRNPALVDFSGLLNLRSIESITIKGYKRLFGDSFKFYSTVTFNKNGETLTKEFDGDSLSDAYQKVYDFCSKLL